jgi:putative flippase GtrA
MPCKSHAPPTLKALLAQLNSKDAHPAIQFLKYSIAGGAAVAVYLSVYLSLVHFVWPELNTIGKDMSVDPWTKFAKTLPPTAIAFVFANIAGYYLNTRWVFTQGRHHPVLEFIYFTLVNLPGALGGTIVQGILIANYGWSANAAFLGFLVPNMLINYICRKFFIFKK